MAHRPPVHVELRNGEWTVVREDSEDATSTHPTQSEAAEVGRDLARREETEFFLHAQDGRVREHRNYGEEPESTEEGGVDLASDTVGAAAGAVGDVLGAVGKTIGPNDATAEDTRASEEAREQAGDAEERYAGYEIYSQDEERLGKPDDLFLDEDDNPEYVGVEIDAALAASTLIPADVVTVDDERRRMVVSRPTNVIHAAPSLGHDDELTPELERRVRDHYGLTGTREDEDSRPYGDYHAGPEIPGAGTVPPEPGLAEEEEERSVRRAEEELRVETREREVGALRVRKRVRTDRERIVVPKKRVEVTVERVPVERGTAETEIGEDEIVVPVIEEEIVVEKRPVVKEEIRIRKVVVEETEVIEEDVRREEIEVDDDVDRGR